MDLIALGGVYRAGGPGAWSSGQIGSRLFFVDPAGKVIFFRGFTLVASDEYHAQGWYAGTQYDFGPTSGKTWNQNVIQKYGSVAAWRVACAARLRLFHYNFVGAASDDFSAQNFPKAYFWLNGWYANFQPYVQGKTTGNEPIHNLLESLPPLPDLPHYGRFIGDWLDPKFAQYISTAPYSGPDPNVLYQTGVDGDFVSQQMGAGHPNETGFHERDSNIVPHTGLLALFNPPTAVSQPSNRDNTVINQWPLDPVIYAKKVLIDDLKAKYVTISGLNSAWGSSYTSFDSDGGWGVGTGLADENGLRQRAWFGSGSPVDTWHSAGNNNLFDSTSWAPAVKVDLDLNLGKQIEAYVKTEAQRIRGLWTAGLYAGPNGGTGGNDAPTRTPVLQALGKWVDLWGYYPNNPALNDYMVGKLGVTLPGICLLYYPATSSDSDLFWAAAHNLVNPDGFTQAQRGQGVANFISNITALKLSNGIYPVGGYVQWNMKSQPGEAKGWGNVTYQDNWLDGGDYRVAKADPYTPGATTIPEDPGHGPYGDTMGPIKAAHIAQLATLQQQIGGPP